MNQHLQTKQLSDDEIVQRAFFDTVYDVYNFRYMLQLLNSENMRATVFQRPYAILIVSIDSYLNAAIQFGHLVVKQMGCTVADILKANCHPVYSIGSFCEGKFMVIMPEATLQSARELAALLIKASQLQLTHQGELIDLSISIGIGCGSRDIEIESLIAIADLGADIAADRGGGNYCFAPTELT